MSADTRLVPMTHADLSWLHVVGDVPQRREALARINKAYDVRPIQVYRCTGCDRLRHVRSRHGCAPDATWVRLLAVPA